MTDLDKLKDELRKPAYLESYLERTGRGVPSGGENMRCPDASAHKNGDAHPSAHFYPDDDGARIKCFGCGGTWDVFALYMLDNGCDFMTALEALAKMFSLPFPSGIAGSKTRLVPSVPRTSKAVTPMTRGEAPLGRSPEIESYLATCAARIDDVRAKTYLEGRGISLAAAKRLGVGFDPASPDLHGEPVLVFPESKGYGVRNLAPAGSREKAFRHLPKGVRNGSAFNLGALWKTRDGDACVFIVEGQFDALAVVEAGGDAVALGGVQHVDELLAAVEWKRPTAPVVVAFDHENDPRTAANVERARTKALEGLRNRGVFAYQAKDPENVFGAHDANDALVADRAAFEKLIEDMAAASGAELERKAALEVPGKTTALDYLKPLADIGEPIPEEDNPDALIPYKYLKRGGALTIVSVAGQGKSVLANQLALAWAAGRECFLPAPLHPLRVLVVQWEDDDDEMRDFKHDDEIGFMRNGWTREELQAAESRVSILEVRKHRLATGRSLADEELAKTLAEIQRSRGDERFDVVIINPLTSALVEYDLSDNSDANVFFRHVLQPVIENPETSCALVLIHHTGKVPKSAQDRENFMRGTFAQYDAQGAAALMNWTRASLMIAPTDTPGDFVLVGAKRQSRLKWKDRDGNPTNEKYISYSPDVMFWIDTPQDRVETMLAKADAKRSGDVFDPQEDALRAATQIREACHHQGQALTAVECRRVAVGILRTSRGNAAWTMIAKNPGAYNLKREKIGRVEYYGDGNVRPPSIYVEQPLVEAVEPDPGENENVFL